MKAQSSFAPGDMVRITSEWWQMGFPYSPNRDRVKQHAVREQGANPVLVVAVSPLEVSVHNGWTPYQVAVMLNTGCVILVWSCDLKRLP